MQTDRPGPSRDSSSVRLTWAEPPAAAPPAPAKAGSAKAPAASTDKAAKASRASKASKVAKAPARGTKAREAPPAPAPGPSPVVADAQTGRVFVEAFDRLADRLLERIRSLRQDVDADLTSVRSELASLRQAVDAVADRVQMRHLRTTLEEVHGDVVGLRRAVLEWPELEQVAEDIAAVRGDLATLATDVARLPSGPSAQVAAPGPALDDEQLERIVDAVAERVAAKLGRRR